MKRNEIFASTGTFIGRANNYDYTQIINLNNKIECDGFELIFMTAWYGIEDEILSKFKKAKIKFPTLHMDKNIGVMFEQGQHEEGMRLFKENLDFALKINSSKLILHLWGGDINDDNMDSVLSHINEMEKLCEGKILLTIENIPCRTHDPLYYWLKLLEYDKDVKFTFDTRFSTYFDQNEEIFESIAWNNVRHVHISAFDPGFDRTKRLIRPILHPGEGIPDFPSLLSNMPYYDGTVTLESPVLSPEGDIDYEKLNKSLHNLRTLFETYNIKKN